MTAKEKFLGKLRANERVTKRKWDAMAENFELSRSCIWRESEFLRGMVSGALFGEVIDEEECESLIAEVDLLEDEGVETLREMEEKIYKRKYEDDEPEDDGEGEEDEMGKAEADRQIRKMNEVMEALANLGYDPSVEVVVIRPIDGSWDRVTVKSGGKPFGIYDFTKHTFVD